MSRLREKFNKEIMGQVQKELGLKNIMQVPRVNKVVVNVCTSEATTNSKVINVAVAELEAITGQKPVVNKAKKAISNFKLRQGMPIACSVTLRGDKMWAFLDRLMNVALPRVRDFKGVSSKGFDGRGNFNMGLKEQVVFPEINFDKVEKVRGMNITICTSAKSDNEGRVLLTSLGFPFRK